MKKISFLFILLFLNLFGSYGQTPTWQWAKNFGGGKSDCGIDIVTDVNGNIFTLGYFRDTVDFDPGPGIFNMIPAATATPLFLTKLDAAGNFIWAKQFGFANYDLGFALNVDAVGNIYVTGYYTGTVDFDPGVGTYNLTSNGYTQYYILKLDNAGNFAWVKTFGGCFNGPRCHTVIDDSGNLITAGSFVGTADFDPGAAVVNLTSVGRDIFILKLDAAGNYIWVKHISGNLNNYVNKIAVDISNNIYLAGSFSGTTDFDPGAGVNTLYGGSITNGDIFVAKYSASGNYGWAKQMAGPNGEQAYYIALDKAGNVYTTGYFNGIGGGVDFDPGPGTYIVNGGGSSCFISKLNTAGNFVYALGFTSVPSGFGSVSGRALAVDGNSNIYFTGTISDTTDFDPGPGIFNLVPDTTLIAQALFICKLDSTGNFVWAEAKGGSYHTAGVLQNSGISIFCDAANNIYFTGRYEDPSITFGATTLLNYTPNTLDYTDAFLAKISSTNTSIKDNVLSNEPVFIYPNPSNGIFTLLLAEKKVSVIIYNLLGEIVFTSAENNHSEINIDLSMQPKGIYMCLLHEKNGAIKTTKIVIQ